MTPSLRAPTGDFSGPSAPTFSTRTASSPALAHYIERLIEAGELKDYAEAAKSLGLTRARLTQIMHLLLLGTELQERLLVGEKPVAAMILRDMARVADWQKQLARTP